jgi:hypothetical protein
VRWQAIYFASSLSVDGDGDGDGDGAMCCRAHCIAQIDNGRMYPIARYLTCRSHASGVWNAYPALYVVSITPTPPPLRITLLQQIHASPCIPRAVFIPSSNKPACIIAAAAAYVVPVQTSHDYNAIASVTAIQWHTLSLRRCIPASMTDPAYHRVSFH